MYLPKNTLIARRGYNSNPPEQGLAGFWDDLSSGLTSFGKGIAAQNPTVPGMMPGVPGAPGVPYNPDIAAAYAAQQGPQLTDYLLYGGIAAAVYFLFIKKKPA